MKRYRELTMPEVLRMLADNLNQKFAFKEQGSTQWSEDILVGIPDFDAKCPYTGRVISKLTSSGGIRKQYSRVAEIIEIPDPLIPPKKLEALQELFSEYEWIAMDRNGGAYIYSTVAPTPIDGYWMPSSFSPYHKLQAFNGYAPDWKNSLIHIPTEIERIKKLEAEA